jgi:hypothetical protein
MKRQPKPVQQLHGLVFAFSVSSILLSYVLYTDYGFWHDTYVRVEEDILHTTKEPVQPESPIGLLGRFARDAKKELEGMQVDTKFLEGKEVYTKSNSN